MKNRSRHYMATNYRQSMKGERNSNIHPDHKSIFLQTLKKYEEMDNKIIDAGKDPRRIDCTKADKILKEVKK